MRFFLLWFINFYLRERTFYLLTQVGERKPDNPKENILNFAILAVPQVLTRWLPYSDLDLLRVYNLSWGGSLQDMDETA